ncbi:MAG: peptide ABC transporter substrate-binding protein [Spirochaetales bacterium]|nr:peptide ABC transporter substrate-binding protein [Spirochaetales bacterium]
MISKGLFPVLAFLLLFSTVVIPAEERTTLTTAYASTEYQWDIIHSYSSFEAQLYTAVYEGLVTYHPFSLQPISGVARFWEVMPDGKTWRFYLRENARYWNGDRVTAAHFRDAWLTLLDPEEKAEYSSLLDVVRGALDYRTGKTTDPETVGLRVLSDTLLEVELEEPADHFLKILCHHSLAPIHPKLLKQRQWNSKTAILSNGPFYVLSWSDEEIILGKNLLYWDASSVELEKIRIMLTDDYEETTARFNSGEIHWCAGGIDWGAVENPNNLLLNPMFATSYLFFSCLSPPFDRADVRRGLALLIPWEEIRSEDYMLLPTAGLVPSIPGYPEAQGIEAQNVNEGLALLNAQGFPKGQGLGDLIIRVPEGGDMERISTLIKDAWETSLDITVAVEYHSYPSYFDVIETRPYTLATITWIGDFADPLTFLQMWTGTSNLNDSGYRNENYDTLLKESMGQTGEKRYETLGVAEALLLSEAAVLPLSHYPALNALEVSLVDGWYPNPLDIHPFKYIRFNKPEIPPSVVMSR